MSSCPASPEDTSIASFVPFSNVAEEQDFGSPETVRSNQNDLTADDILDGMLPQESAEEGIFTPTILRHIFL